MLRLIIPGVVLGTTSTSGKVTSWKKEGNNLLATTFGGTSGSCNPEADVFDTDFSTNEYGYGSRKILGGHGSWSEEQKKCPDSSPRVAWIMFQEYDGTTEQRTVVPGISTWNIGNHKLKWIYGPADMNLNEFQNE